MLKSGIFPLRLVFPSVPPLPKVNSLFFRFFFPSQGKANFKILQTRSSLVAMVCAKERWKIDLLKRRGKNGGRYLMKPRNGYFFLGHEHPRVRRHAGILTQLYTTENTVKRSEKYMTVKDREKKEKGKKIGKKEGILLWVTFITFGSFGMKSPKVSYLLWGRRYKERNIKKIKNPSSRNSGEKNNTKEKKAQSN